MFQSPEFNQRVFPIVLKDADIFSFEGQASYLSFWSRKLKEVGVQQREVSEEDPTLAIPLTMRLRDIQLTTRFINDFMARVADMNVLTPEHHEDNHFGLLIQAVEERANETDISDRGEESTVTTASRDRILITHPIGMEFIRIPAGEFLMGSDSQVDKNANMWEESPQLSVTLSEYYIGKMPVINSQYAHFVSAKGHKPPAYWKKGKIPKGKADHPVVKVSWNDAVAFCKWLSKESGHNIRLPTEAEWEKAARGTEGQIYPWGNKKPNKKRANFNQMIGTTTEVGRYSPQGDSPFGCVDMAGNAEEWVGDRWATNYYRTLQDGVINPTGPERGDFRGLKGGSWAEPSTLLRCAVRNGSVPYDDLNQFGFRCALIL